MVVLAVALLTATVLGRSWNACDAGVSNSVNGSFLLLMFIPVLWFVLMLVWLGAGAFLREHHVVRAVVVGALMLAVCWCAVSLFWEGDTYHCPGGVPSWWPGFAPTPGF
ncbi:hypothetical protein ACWCQK_28565 [Streptomyces sp. NPDC002306]